MKCMNNILNYTFPAGQTDALSLTGDYAGDGTIPLNGLLANQVTKQIDFLSLGYSRSVSVTTDDEVDVTIEGYQNQKFISETITAVAGDTTYGDEIFDTITEISISGAADNFSVGTGTKGFFPIITIPDSNLDLYNLTLASTNTPISTAIYGTLKNILKPNSQGQRFTYLEWKEDYNLFPKKALSADSQYYTDENNVWKFLLVYLEGDNLTIDQTVELHFAYSLS